MNKQISLSIYHSLNVYWVKGQLVSYYLISVVFVDSIFDVVSYNIVTYVILKGYSFKIFKAIFKLSVSFFALAQVMALTYRVCLF